MSQAKVFTALVLAPLVGASLNAVAAEAYPKQIQKITESGVKVVKTFTAASKLKGWVLSKGERYSLVFTTPDNKTMIAGELIDEAGNNLTAQYADQYIPKPDRNALYQQLDQATFITEGTPGSPKAVIYAFFDPNCPFCHLAWKALQPYEKVGLQVRWLPVAYLMESSPGKAAAILEAKDRLAAFRENESKYNNEKHEGGIAPLAKMSANSQKQLQANGALMQKFGATGTPALVWKDSHGKVQVKAGLPRLSELPAMTGLPEQPEDDPDLARFR